MKLWSGVLSPFSAKVRIALAEKKLGYETLVVPWSRKTLWGPKPPEFLAVSPHGQVPVLIDGDVAVFDSTVICEYLEDRYPKPPLLPAGPEARRTPSDRPSPRRDCICTSAGSVSGRIGRFTRIQSGALKNSAARPKRWD